MNQRLANEASDRLITAGNCIEAMGRVVLHETTTADPDPDWAKMHRDLSKARQLVQDVESALYHIAAYGGDPEYNPCTSQVVPIA